MKPAKSPPEPPRHLLPLLLAAAACLHLSTALFLGSGHAGFRAALCAWSLAPYAVLAMAMRRGAGFGLLGGAALMLLADGAAFWSVFLAPRQSTAALNLLAAPLWNLLGIAPAALVIELYLRRRR